MVCVLLVGGWGACGVAVVLTGLVVLFLKMPAVHSSFLQVRMGPRTTPTTLKPEASSEFFVLIPRIRDPKALNTQSPNPREANSDMKAVSFPAILRMCLSVKAAGRKRQGSGSGCLAFEVFDLPLLRNCEILQAFLDGRPLNETYGSPNGALNPKP